MSSLTSDPSDLRCHATDDLGGKLSLLLERKMAESARWQRHEDAQVNKPNAPDDGTQICDDCAGVCLVVSKFTGWSYVRMTSLPAQLYRIWGPKNTATVCVCAM